MTYITSVSLFALKPLMITMVFEFQTFVKLNLTTEPGRSYFRILIQNLLITMDVLGFFVSFAH